MIRILAVLGAISISVGALAQTKLDKLTVEKIMRDPKWIGSSPSNVFWDHLGEKLYFSWNPEKSPDDSLYYISLNNTTPVKAGSKQKQDIVSADALVFNQKRTAAVYMKDGDIFYYLPKSKILKRITQTTDFESSARFSFSDNKIVYTRNENLYSWDPVSGETMQLTNIKTESSGTTGGQKSGSVSKNISSQEDWLKNDQLKYFEVLRLRKEKKDAADNYDKNTRPKELRSIAIEDRNVQNLTISPDGRFVSYTLVKRNQGKATIVPNYVTETGFTTDINARTKVGTPQNQPEFFLYDRQKDTIYSIKTDSIPGIKDIPVYVKDYPIQYKIREKKNSNRDVGYLALQWSPSGKYAVLDIRSSDNKDRWLMSVDTASSRLSILNRQHDNAWIGGPGIGQGTTMGWLDDETFYFQSEETGYSHLYKTNVRTKTTAPITTGNYEVISAKLSLNKKYFYLVTNAAHPGEQQFYRLTIASSKTERITTMSGANQVSISPDGKRLALLYSSSNQPWELFLQENKPGTIAKQITNIAASDEFKSYNWRVPELVTFTAEDGATVYARLYKTSNFHPNKPAVLFVHGAGYLQNAHKWWSSYFREYMFNNLLADNGYYVMDIDYRGSAGYGRDWRTGIYRHMGGKDLTDNVDAVKYLVKNYGVNPAHVGLYGGSYGGFITLMALFTKPDVFTVGAALRPVTDWANYNHGYTSNILNEPFNDSIAYRRSSPLYFAEGLKGNLLICHGMVDVNVHFQDAVKLTQRLIELEKDNWELAGYPMEDHGFVEPSSWTDEYKRIFKLFETVLKR